MTRRIDIEPAEYTATGHSPLCSGFGCADSCEHLEPRLLLSATVFNVDSLDDVVAADGVVTLREAIEAANTNTAVYDAPAGSDVDTDIINFDASLFTGGAADLLLSGTELEITDSLDINGPGSDLLSIDAGGQSRVFNISTAVTAAFDGVTVTGGNVVGDGGGIYGYLGSIPLSLPGCTIIVTDSVIADNTAAGNAGGVVGATLMISGTTVSGNSASDFGGIYGYDVNVDSSVISFNSATGSSGGVFGSPLMLSNTVIMGNSAGGYGGGVYGSIIGIVNSTITANSAGTNGGGVYVRNDAATLVNSIIALNEGGDIHGQFTITNTILSVDPGFVANPTDGGDGWGDDPATTEVDESANDDAGDLHLLDTSAALNFGDNALALDTQGVALVYDLDGNPRIFGSSSTVDAGAYELQADSAPGRESPSATVTTTLDIFDLFDGDTSLREAIWNLTTAQVAGDSVDFNSALSGQTIELASQLRIDADTIVDASVLNAAITLDAIQSGRGILVSYGTELTLRAINITNGQTLVGAAIYGDAYSEISLDGVELTANSASQFGGAVYAGANAILTIADSVLSGNSSGSSGGAIYLGEDATLDISGSLLQDNEAGMYSLGGVIAATQVDVVIDDTEIVGNSAGWSGGAIDLLSSTLEITDSFIHNNRSRLGGAISALLTTVEMTDVIVAGNYASDSGGGIYMYNADLETANSLLVGNESLAGGGIYASQQSTVVLANSNLVSNRADTGAGLESDNSTITLNNTLACLNGPGLDILGTYSSNNSLVAIASPFVADPSDGGDGWSDDPATTEIDESANDYFGDQRLRLGSPCIDAGDNALALDGGGLPLVYDYRGGQRMANGVVDIGAFEFQYLPGDANGDETVNLDDFIVLKQNYGSGTSWDQGDFNGDGIVNLDDFIILKQNYGTSFTPAE